MADEPSSGTTQLTESDTRPAEPAPPPRRRSWPVFAVIAVGVIVFLVGGAGGSYQSKLGEVQKNDNASYLPASAESTIAGNEAEKFTPVQNIPGFVVFHRDAGLTPADKSAIDGLATTVRDLPGVDAQAVTPPEYSEDGQTASLFVPLIASNNGEELNGEQLLEHEQEVLRVARDAAPDGLDVHSAGPGGLLVAFIDAFSGLDSTLLLTAVGVIFVILLLVYRSIVLPFLPLISAGLALGVSSLVVYFLAKNEVLTLTGQSQSILSVLVLGAGTDYALLLIARYREELHEYAPFDAMIAAWKASIQAIVASAATVTIALLCLSFSELNSNKSLGPVSAIGIVCTLVVMTTFLPLSLVLVPKLWFWPIPQLLAYVVPRLRRARPEGARGIFWTLNGSWVFWPRIPHRDHQSDIASHGFWSRLAGLVGRWHRIVWIGATVLLLLCLAGLTSLKTDGLTTAESFTTKPDAVVGQELYDANFAKGAGAPAVIVTDASETDAVIAAARDTEGVAQTPGSVCVQPDYAKLSAATSGGGPPPVGADGCLDPSFQVAPIDGRIVVNATLADSYDSPAAYDTIERLRTAVHGVSGADAKVGGASAANLDVSTASVHDRNLIIPIVLAVIFVILAVLFRALLAPVLLIATVVLSFAATLGVCGFMFTHVFGFEGADQSFPLFAFVFLVALGIDYNIFLMTRVREEALSFGTRQGVLRGLSVTGGVITSAGIVLAATFVVLGILPLVFLAEIGFAVAFGVLLDTIIVRSLLVPALSYDIGRRIWWPSRLAAGKD
ncbi:MMPL family transporter [Cryptosporangium aurantiacum]|uniref:Putative drug exporter of the RND superfamily n=1 Tax=Cryptosporangium aurantiacum TaxID=134849 RepID=A0A1M7TXP2_9ACTN|nr:MMPL family transporter [Cryptosporangium aurantiacum]SHN75499.1 putative drug exporter of the RND superfamily [Cryptosporangium aurantiacum]